MFNPNPAASRPALPWALGDSGDLGGLLAAFAVDDPVHGRLFEIPVELWPAFFFTDRQGNIAPGSPSVADIVAAGYNALGEPVTRAAIASCRSTGPTRSTPCNSRIPPSSSRRSPPRKIATIRMID